jgi:hypothetical protein
MVDAIKFDTTAIDESPVECIYVEKYNVISYYYSDMVNRSINVIPMNKHPSAYFNNKINNIKAMKISLNEVERFQKIVELTKELEDMKKGGWIAEDI